MTGDLFVSLFFGMKSKDLPPDFDYEAAGLEIISAGVKGVEGVPYEEFVGLPVGEDLSGLNEITGDYIAFEEIERVKLKAEERFRKAGVKRKVRMYIIQGME